MSSRASVPASAAGVRRRNRRGQGALLRADILAAAAAILDETGDEQAVALRAVARRVGIAAPSIYAHFPDRQSILVAIVRDAFAELRDRLVAAAEAAGADPSRQLHAVCAAYLDFAAARPQRYRIMFGGLWSAAEALPETALAEAEAAEIGRDALRVLVDVLGRCVAAGRSASTEPAADAVALWGGLHGLAHQRSLALAFPWPDDIVERLVTSLARLRHPGEATRAG